VCRHWWIQNQTSENASPLRPGMYYNRDEKHPGGSFATHGSISPHWGIKKEDKKLQDGSKKNVPLLPIRSSGWDNVPVPVSQA
jgi:hypothetical protein